jgi:hypothetical protein
MAAEIGTELELIFGWDVGEVLVTKSYDFSLSNE